MTMGFGALCTQVSKKYLLQTIFMWKIYVHIFGINMTGEYVAVIKGEGFMVAK